jgi:hypothetical protein
MYTNARSPENLAIVFFLGTQQEKIMGSEGGFYGFDYGKSKYYGFGL